IAGTNYAPGGGGGINMDPFGSASGTITNSIIHNTAVGGTCAGPNLTSGGHNLESSTSCGFTAAGDITLTDPLLGPLGNNSGSTFTHALLPGSAAIDAGTNVGAPATDQRGISRPYGTAVDIGAYEFIPAGSAPVRIAGGTPVYYPTIQSGYDAAVNGDVLEVQGTDFVETVLFNRGTSVMLRGGYDPGFSIRNLMTRLTGSASVNSGSVLIDNLSIQ
ncbi:MAG: choice-of-anchor Q domain-containing protein, partial [Thermodesulfovibrionales bacterium]